MGGDSELPLRGQLGGGGRVSKGYDRFLDNSRENIKQGNVEGRKLFGFFVNLRVLKLGLHGHRLLGGSDHKGPDGVAIKEGFGGVGEGGDNPE